MRFGTIACAALLSCVGLAGEAAAMRLATFEFEGTVDSSLTAPHTVSGSFTIDMDATRFGSDETYLDAIVDFTLAYNSGEGTATSQYEPGGTFGGSSDGIIAAPRQGVSITRWSNGDWLKISAPLSGEPGFIYQTVRPFLSVSDTYLEIDGFEITGIGASGETGLATESILSLANEGMTFVLFGMTSERGTATTESMPTSDFFIPEPDPSEFMAQGTIDSLTLVSQVPLPAAAWLMLSGLAAMAGVRAWPRAKGT